MEINPTIYKAIKDNNNMISTENFVKLGFSKTLIANYVKAGLLERVRHGIYILPDDAHDDMFSLMLCSEKIIFSHDTAAFLNGISLRTPFIHSVTIPSGSTLPKTIQNECKCYYIKPELHDIGLIEKTTNFGNNVSVYNPERTICDLLRSRSRVDEELVIDTIKNYILTKDKDINLLFYYSKKFGVEKKLKSCMEVLI